MKPVSRRAAAIRESPTLGLNARVKAMQAAGKRVVNFTVGEPDFRTPDNVGKAAAEAIRAGFTKYTAVAGIPELRKAISRKLLEENGLEFGPEEIIVSCGGKHSLYNAFQALCDPGDEVIIPAPYWVTYPEQVRLAGAKPVFVQTREKDGFRLLARDVEEKASKKTKAILLNTPNNPTGAVYGKAELEKIASVAAGCDAYVISDEIYEHLVYGERHVSIASLGTDIRKRTIIVNGASKSYAMTGWRIGWAAGPPDVVKAMCSLQSHMTSNADSVAQKAYLEALTGGQESVARMAAEFRKRRDFIVRGLNGIPGMRCPEPGGAFYAFPNVSGCFVKGIGDSMDFAERLLNEAGVAVVPGSDFGTEGHVRISYACSMDEIREGLARMAAFAGRLGLKS